MNTSDRFLTEGMKHRGTTTTSCGSPAPAKNSCGVMNPLSNCARAPLLREPPELWVSQSGPETLSLWLFTAAVASFLAAAVGVWLTSREGRRTRLLNGEVGRTSGSYATRFGGTGHQQHRHSRRPLRNVEFGHGAGEGRG
jgi:hypothetical protein